ncbi:MAG: hypothetical protein H6707_13095 [Deltaproteobacteria bacterium]|nr:hypothetical protein [Deltaproteobacteria bacterium]
MQRALLLSCLLGLSACPQDRRMALRENVEAFNDSVRWSRPMFAASYVQPKGRDAFLRRHSAAATVRVTDYNVGRVAYRSPDVAVVLISLDWYRVDQGAAHRTVVMQTWSHEEGRWLLAEQRWVSGPSCPLFSAGPAMKTK